MPRAGISATVVGNQALFAGGAIDPAPVGLEFTPQSAVDIYTDSAPAPVLSGGLTGAIGHRDKVVVLNTGDADLASGYTVQLYASTDRTLNGAILVGTKNASSSLAAGASFAFNVRTRIPRGTLAGKYYLLAAVKDSAGNITPIAAKESVFRVGGVKSAGVHASSRTWHAGARPEPGPLRL